MPDLDVAVVLQHAPARARCRPRLQLHRVREPVHVRVGHPLLELDRLELADLLDPAGREQVVEDRLVAGEALEAHDLLDEQRRVAVLGRVRDRGTGRGAWPGCGPGCGSASVAPLGRVVHAAHEQQCAGGACSIAHSERAVEDQVEGVGGSATTARAVTTVTAAARVPASSTSTRARWSTRPSAFAPGPVDQLVEVAARLGRPGRARARSAGRSRSSDAVVREARQLDACREPARRHVAARLAASPSIATKRSSSVAVRQPDRVRRPRRSVPSTRIIATSPAPSNGAGAWCGSNGSVHFASRYSASVITSDLVRRSSESRMRGIIPCVLLVRPGVDGGERRAARCPSVSAGPGAVARRRATPPAPRGSRGSSSRSGTASPSTSSSARARLARRAARGRRPAPACSPYGERTTSPLEALQQREQSSSGRMLGMAESCPYRLPRSACSRSMASNSALKLPSPKPRAPWRSITSRKTVGRSPIGLVKICSR